MSPIYGQCRTKWPRENLSLGPTAGHAHVFVGIMPLSTNMGYIHQAASRQPRRSLAYLPAWNLSNQGSTGAKPSAGPSHAIHESLIELAFTFAKSYSQFMIKIHSGRPHGVKFAKIFGNNA